MRNPAKNSKQFSRTAASAAVIAALAAASAPAFAADPTSYTIGNGETNTSIIAVNYGETADITVQNGGVISLSGGVDVLGAGTTRDPAVSLSSEPLGQASVTVEKGGAFLGYAIAGVTEWMYDYPKPNDADTYPSEKAQGKTTLAADISGLWMGQITVGTLADVNYKVEESGILSNFLTVDPADARPVTLDTEILPGWYYLYRHELGYDTENRDYSEESLISSYTGSDEIYAYALSGGAAADFTAGQTTNRLIAGYTYDWSQTSSSSTDTVYHLYLTEKQSDTVISVDGVFYGPIVLTRQDSSATVTIGKTGVWSYAYMDKAGTSLPSVAYSYSDSASPFAYIIPVVTAVTETYDAFKWSYDDQKFVVDNESGYDAKYRSDPTKNGGKFNVAVQGKWIGNALIGYLGAFNSPFTNDPNGAADLTGIETAKQSNYQSFQAVIGNEDGTEASWTGTLISKGGAWSTVNVMEGSVWRYNPETVATTTNALLSGVNDTGVTNVSAFTVPTTVFGNAPTVILATGMSDVDLAIDGTLYGGALVTNQSTVTLTLGKNGVWRAVVPGEDPADYVYQYEYYVDDLMTEASQATANETSVDTNRGPVTARVYDGSEMNVTVSGAWTGDAVSQGDDSALDVTIAPTGSWHFSELNKAITSDTDAAGVQDKTLAAVYGGATLTLRNYGLVTGLINVQGTGTGADTDTFTNTVTGTWNGPLYTVNGAVSSVTVGGTLSTDGSTVTVTDTAANTGVWNIAGTDSDGQALAYAASQPAIAYASGTGSALNITVNQGGTLNGDILISDSATGTVTNSGTWNGNAEADGGSLTVTNAGSWTGDIWAKNNAAVTLTVTGSWTGTVKDPELTAPTVTLYSDDTDSAVGTNSVLISESVLAAAAADTGISIAVTLSGADASWTMTESTEVAALTVDSGSVSFPAAATDGSFTGSTLTVDGDYQSNGGTIKMNTVLGGDDSKTDKMIVKGNTSGSTTLKVNNVGGAGAQTTDGITLIEVDGTSDGTFTLSGTVRGGAYVYSLGKADKNWVLTSLLDPEPEPEPDPDPTPTPEPTPAPDLDIEDHAVRPEAASYATNLYAANTMFAMKLSDRLGGAAFSESLKSGSKRAGSVWLRTAGGHTRRGMADGQTVTRGNYGLAQIGGDFITWPGAGGQRFHAGFMAGYAHERSKTGSSVVNYQSKGKTDGYSVGLYGTWMNSEPTGAGPYVDTWVQYQRYKNTVDSSDYEVEETYHTHGFTVSLEGGYTFRLGDWKGEKGYENATRLRLEGQVIRMGVRGGDHFERSTRTLVQGTGAGNVRTRLGLTAYHLFTNDTAGTAVKPYLTMNWYHDTKRFGAIMDGTRDTITGSRNFGEVKLGVEGRIRKNVNFWGAAGYQQGTHGFRKLEAQLGAKILF